MVVDTSVLIEHIRAKDKLNTALYRLPDNKKYFVSSITLYELYMGATDKEKEHDVREFTKHLSVLPFTEVVAFKAAEIYNQLKKQSNLIEFRDIFIAATCIVNDLPLVTLNKKHFKRIAELNVL